MQSHQSEHPASKLQWQINLQSKIFGRREGSRGPWRKLCIHREKMQAPYRPHQFLYSASQVELGSLEP